MKQVERERSQGWRRSGRTETEKPIKLERSMGQISIELDGVRGFESPASTKVRTIQKADQPKAELTAPLLSGDVFVGGHLVPAGVFIHQPRLHLL